MDFLHSYRLVRSKMVADAFEVATPRSRKTGETWGTRQETYPEKRLGCACISSARAEHSGSSLAA